MGSRDHNFYNEAYQRAGFQDIALDVQRTWLDGRRDEAREMIPDELVIKTNLLGREEQVKDRIRAFRDSGVTTIRVQPEGRGMSDTLDTLGRFMGLLGTVNAEATEAARA
jgi:hypothetical protein